MSRTNTFETGLINSSTILRIPTILSPSLKEFQSDSKKGWKKKILKLYVNQRNING